MKRVAQLGYLALLDRVGGSAPLDEVAEFLGVSQATARRKLDGLASQGFADRWPGGPRSGPACYGLTNAGRDRLADELLLPLLVTAQVPPDEEGGNWRVFADEGSALEVRAWSGEGDYLGLWRSEVDEAGQVSVARLDEEGP